VNGDGFDDVFVLSSGQPSVVFGHGGAFAATFDLSAVDGENGFTLYGPGVVENAGDINGDGFPDLIVGRAGSSPHGTYSGAAYVVFGTADGFPARVDVFALNGQNGFTLNGGTAL
jgi:hypothetical protein